ncbi:MAG: iron chelate uptake ABC transporter family permease subunit [Pelagimonas sp.]|nr:iron chelate uptake ABC transporter family permease subunit [Pelagimonas sp.]
MAKTRLILLAISVLLVSALFLVWNLRGPVWFILELRSTKLLALLLVGAATGVATVLFQTVANNRLLTPGLVGFDALFVFLQTALILTLGGIGYVQMPESLSFVFEALVLLIAAQVLFQGLMRRSADDVMKMVLTGIILGTLLRGLAEMGQRLLDPSEFAIVQQSMFASFGAVAPARLGIAAVIFVGVFACALYLSPALDVAALGRQRARALGLGYDRLILQALALLSVLVAVSTALVGPITFLGLLAASLAREIVPAHRHKLILPASALVGAFILVIGQFLFERLLGLQSTLAVVVELFGGAAFLFLILRRRAA